MGEEKKPKYPPLESGEFPTRAGFESSRKLQPNPADAIKAAREATRVPDAAQTARNGGNRAKH